MVAKKVKSYMYFTSFAFMNKSTLCVHFRGFLFSSALVCSIGVYSKSLFLITGGWNSWHTKKEPKVHEMCLPNLMLGSITHLDVWWHVQAIWKASSISRRYSYRKINASITPPCRWTIGEKCISVRLQLLQKLSCCIRLDGFKMAIAN